MPWCQHHIQHTYVPLLNRALRWRYLTDPIQPIERGPLFRATAVGFMTNNLLPLRAGELIRAWYLSRETGANGTTLHVTWCRRGHGPNIMCHLTSPDAGRTWTSAAGAAAQLPVTEATRPAALVDPEDDWQGSMTVDERNRPRLVGCERRGAKLYHALWDGRAWQRWPIEMPAESQ